MILRIVKTYLQFIFSWYAFSVPAFQAFRLFVFHGNSSQQKPKQKSFINITELTMVLLKIIIPLHLSFKVNVNSVHFYLHVDSFKNHVCFQANFEYFSAHMEHCYGKCLTWGQRLKPKIRNVFITPPGTAINYYLH